MDTILKTKQTKLT